MFIPDPGSEFFPISDPGSTSKNSSIITQQRLSEILYDPGCSSRIRSLTFYPSRIPDPGVKKAPDPGSTTMETTTQKREIVLKKGQQGKLETIL
jgi:hypothetical protein